MITTGKLGCSITITGDNLYSISRVVFCSEVTGNFIESNNSIITTVPYHAAWGRIRLESIERKITGYSKFLFVPEPLVTGWYPNSGIPGDTITIGGYAFSGITGVTFNNLNSSSVNVISNFSLTATVPTGNTKGQIKVFGQSGLYYLSSNEFLPVAVISGISPSALRTGEMLTISGSNFLPEILYGSTDNYYVSINGATGIFSLINSMKMTGLIPSNATSGPVNILQNANSVYPSAFSVYIYPSPPVISYFYPTSGTAGQRIFCYGSNLTPSGILVSGNSTGTLLTGSSIGFNSFGTICYFDNPSGLLYGDKTIYVYSSGGTGSNTGFFYLSPCSVTGVSNTYVYPNQIITISGTNLYSNSQVCFDDDTDILFPIHSGNSSNTEIYFRMPGYRAFSFYLNVFNGINFAKTPTSLVYGRKVEISGFNPTSGIWGSTVSLSGSSFSSAYECSLNDFTGNFTIIGDTGINFIIPTGTSNGYFTVKNSGGVSYSSSSFSVIDPDLSILNISPNPVRIQSEIIISGTYLSRVTGLYFSGVSGFVISDFAIDSGNNIRATVPFDAVSGKIKLLNRKNSYLSSSNLNVIGYPRITGISHSVGGWPTTITISGDNFSGVQFYFTKYDGTYISGLNTNISSLGVATTETPKEIITSDIAVSGIGGMSRFGYYFTPLPKIMSIDPSSIGGYTENTLQIEAVNGYEITGFAISGSGMIENIISSPSDLSFDLNSEPTHVVITAQINGNFYGTGYIYPVVRSWDNFNSNISSNYSGTKYQNLITITGRPTFSGFYPTTGGLETTIYISGRNLKRISNIFLSGYYLGNSDIGYFYNLEKVSDKLITGKIGNVQDIMFQDNQIKIIDSLDGSHIGLQNPTYPDSTLTYLKKPSFVGINPDPYTSYIFTGDAVVLSGMYLQSLDRAYLKDGFGNLRTIDIFNSWKNIYGNNVLNMEYLTVYIPKDRTLVNQTVDIYFVNAANETGYYSGIKISDIEEVRNLNDLEAKIYIFN